MVDASRYVARLDGRGHDAALVGGKAAAIDRLIAAGFNVPPALAVTTPAYRAFIEEADLAGTIAAVAADTTTDSETLVNRIEDAFLAAPMPPDLLAALHEACGSLSASVMAVRSSSVAEDLTHASFAGQYLSVLGVEGFDEMAEAIRRVWASLWHPWATLYRRRMGITDDDLTMAVIVQRQVPSERSGVVFTADPIQPALLRLEAVEGLGEGLVSGDVTPTVHLLRRPGLQPADGRPLDPALRDAAHEALRVEQTFDAGPQDVEWTVAAGRVWVLQARPVTTSGAAEPGDGFDTLVAPAERHVAAGVTEMLPGVLPPLIWTINAPMVEESFRSLFARLKALPHAEELRGPFGFLVRRRGRARLNLSLMERIGERMPGWSAEEVRRLYLGTEPAEEGAGPAHNGPASPLAAWRGLRLRGDAPRQALAFVSSSRAPGPVPGELLDHELVAYRWRLRDLAAVGVRAEMAVAAVAVAAYRALEEMLERWIGDEAAVWAQRLTREAGRSAPTPSGVAAARLAALDGEARTAVAAALADEAAPPTAERLRGLGPGAASFVDAVERDLARLGSAAVYAGETWHERADLVWASLPGTRLASAGSGGARRDLEEMERRLTSMRRWKVTRWLTGQVVDMRLRFFRRLVADAVELLGAREDAKAALLAVGGRERTVILEMARRLTRRGLLDRAGDVELLADWELDDLLLARHGPAPAEMKRRRRALRRWRAEPVSAAPPAGERRELLQGWGASPGSHRGPAWVVLDPSEPGALPAGAVLVAPATDPSWVPLMLRAGALVVERGGPLSHAAIVAREFGLPAVLNVPGATSLLDTGAEVEVDGATGTVRILAPAARQEERS